MVFSQPCYCGSFPVFSSACCSLLPGETSGALVLLAHLQKGKLRVPRAPVLLTAFKRIWFREKVIQIEDGASIPDLAWFYNQVHSRGMI